MVTEERCEVCGGGSFALEAHVDRPEGRLDYLRCHTCGLVRLVGPEIYDYTNPKYIEILARQGLGGDALWLFVLDQIEAQRPPGRLIEVGCGVGTQLARARERGWEAWGYDINPDCVQVAEALHGIEVRCTDFCELEEEGIADVVLMNQLIEHVPDPRPFLAASRRALAPGGLLVLTTPNWNFARPWAWLHRKAGAPLPPMDHIKPDQHIRLYAPETMRHMAQNHGWTIRSLVENPTDLLGGRGRLSGRRLLGSVTRAVAAASGQRLQVGMNMLAILQDEASS